MKYTEAQIEEIMKQLWHVTIDGEPVFIVIPDETEHPYHVILLDSGPTVARLEFEKADEQRA